MPLSVTSKKTPTPVGVRPQDNLLVVLGVLIGVIEQIHQCRGHGVRVGHDGRQIRLDVDLESAAGSARIARGPRRPLPRRHRAGSISPGEKACLFRSMRENVRKLSIKRPSRAFSLAISSRYSRTLRGRRLSAAGSKSRLPLIRQQRIDQQPDRRQRRFQFVRHRGHQIVLQPGQPHLPPEAHRDPKRQPRRGRTRPTAHSACRRRSCRGPSALTNCSSFQASPSCQPGSRSPAGMTWRKPDRSAVRSGGSSSMRTPARQILFAGQLLKFSVDRLHRGIERRYAHWPRQIARPRELRLAARADLPLQVQASARFCKRRPPRFRANSAASSSAGSVGTVVDSTHRVQRSCRRRCIRKSRCGEPEQRVVE